MISSWLMLTAVLLVSFTHLEQVTLWECMLCSPDPKMVEAVLDFILFLVRIQEHVWSMSENFLFHYVSLVRQVLNLKISRISNNFVLGSKLLQSQNQVWLESKTALWSQRLKELRWQSSLQLQLVVWKSSKLRATSKVAWARSDHPVTSVSTFNSVSHRGSLSTTSAIKIIRLIQWKS